MGQRDAADFLRQAVGDEAVEESLRTLAGDLELGEAGEVQQADALAHGAASSRTGSK